MTDRLNQKFISKSNFVLRSVLNSEEGLEILKDFIQTILKISIQEIRLNPYLKKKASYLPSEENFGIADVRIKTQEQEELNVGVQFIDGKYVQTKMLMYYIQIHANQIEYQDHRKIAKTVTINLLDFSYFDSTDYHKQLSIPTKEGEGYQEEKIELHVLELPKFNLKPDKENSKEEWWIQYLKGDEKGFVDLAKEKNETIKQLDDLLEKFWLEEKLE